MYVQCRSSTAYRFSCAMNKAPSVITVNCLQLVYRLLWRMSNLSMTGGVYTFAGEGIARAGLSMSSVLPGANQANIYMKHVATCDIVCLTT